MIAPEVRQALVANAERYAWILPGPFDPLREWDRCCELGAAVLTPGLPGYPPFLASIADPPKALYVLGNPAFAAQPAVQPALALVGSRRPTPYGLRVARRLTDEIARAGIATVSGLARGIDTEVHRATLDAGGLTWAVLGSGLDRPYPPENVRLLHQIVERGGAVVTEVPLSGPPTSENFPRRNRIISGLSCATVVVEGTRKSGALITAKSALEQGREVFAVPGPVDSGLSDGPNGLLRDGAPPVSCLDDIFQQLPMLESACAASRPGAANRNACGRGGAEGNAFVARASAAASTPEEKKILKLLGSEPLHLEDILRSTGWLVEQVIRVLTEMELKELIDSHPGQRYAKH